MWRATLNRLSLFAIAGPTSGTFRVMLGAFRDFLGGRCGGALTACVRGNPVGSLLKGVQERRPSALPSLVESRATKKSLSLNQCQPISRRCPGSCRALVALLLKEEQQDDRHMGTAGEDGRR